MTCTQTMHVRVNVVLIAARCTSHGDTPWSPYTLLAQLSLHLACRQHEGERWGVGPLSLYAACMRPSLAGELMIDDERAHGPPSHPPQTQNGRMYVVGVRRG